MRKVEAGLTSEEAARLLAEVGPNEVEGDESSAVLAFLGRFWGPMPWLLEIAAALALVVGHGTEALVIVVLLVVNAVIGTVQSEGAKRAVALLGRELESSARVLRDGAWGTVRSRDLVPGDVVMLSTGSVAPADVTCLWGEAQADFSAVTGESVPRSVRPGDELPAGGVVASGSLGARVCATGERSALGRTAALVRRARPRSHQQELLFLIVRYMMLVGVAASVAVGGYALAIGGDPLEVASLVVTFLMGAVPVALPAVLAIVQAAGAMALSHEGVLVTRLDSVEDAASIDVFCFDKTGTITENQLEVTEVVPVHGRDEGEVVLAALLASSEAGADPIDAACRRCAGRAGVSPDGWGLLSLTPFEPGLRRSEAVAERAGEAYRFVKGAPRTLLALCAAAPDEAARVEEVAEGLSRRGLRCVAVASAREGNDLSLLGLLGLSDPPRADAGELIGRMRGLGIRCVMLTGDDRAIAGEVARAVGIGGRVVGADELRGLEGEGRLRLAETVDGIAEVYPEDKYELVRTLQEAGHSVGMTGDGVNDAPALRQAELGCAVLGASEVARASASAVLVRPGLSAIVSAVSESRRAYQRMLTWVINKVTKVVEVVALFSVAYVATGEMPVSLLGMSLLVFANDFATMSIATDNVSATSSPNSWDLGSIVRAAGVLGVLFAAEDLVVAWLGASVLGLGAEGAHTLVMYALVLNSQVRILTVRERGRFWRSVPSAGMLVVAAAVTLGFTALVLSGLVVCALPPLAVASALVVCGLGGLVLDAAKVALFRVFGVA